MTPPVTVTAALMVLALVPGWIYLRLARRLRPRATDNALNQLLEVLAIGAATTGGSALAVAFTPHRLLPFAVDVDAWVKGGPDYLREDWRAAALTLALVLGLASAIAYGIYKVQTLRQPPEFQGSGSLWVQALGNRSPGAHPWIALYMDDRRVIEGSLHAFSLDEEPEKRDISLSGPVRVIDTDGSEPKWITNVDRIVVPGAKISFITVFEGVANPRPSRWQKWVGS